MTNETLKQDIAEVLETSLGAADTYTVKELAMMLGIDMAHETGPKIRKAIRELVFDGYPIASCGNGYYRIRRRVELDEYVTDLQIRVDSIVSRMHAVTQAYQHERDSRHTDPNISVKDRCRYFVIYLAETCKVPYQAVYAMAYRRLGKIHGIDTVNLPAHYQGSVLNYLDNYGYCNQLFTILQDLEEVLV